MAVYPTFSNSEIGTGIRACIGSFLKYQRAITVDGNQRVRLSRILCPARRHCAYPPVPAFGVPAWLAQVSMIKRITMEGKMSIIGGHKK